MQRKHWLSKLGQYTGHFKPVKSQFVYLQVFKAKFVPLSGRQEVWELIPDRRGSGVRGNYRMCLGPNWPPVNLECIPFWMRTNLSLVSISKKEMMWASKVAVN